MNAHPSFLRFSKLILVTIFLVILAGGVVRMTQSGMGCPDWPKCFGRWIPPVSVEQLPENYKEIYAFKYVDTSFNPYHTWIEYINRLLGALLGLLLLFQFFASFRFWKTNKKIVWLTLFIFCLTGLQGWLGSKVVEANLEMVKVTTHMLVALLIAALQVTIIFNLSSDRIVIENKKIKRAVLLAIILLLIQIIFGTQVREQIDHISARYNFKERNLWIDNLNYVFYIHRSFSLIIAAVCFYIFYYYRKKRQLQKNAWLILFCIMGSIFLGLLMTYFNIPAIAQPLHLLLSSVLLISVFYNRLKII